MRILFACLFFAYFLESFGMESRINGSIYDVSDNNRGLSGYLRLRVTSYFPVKVPLLSCEDDRECLLKKDGNRIVDCRNKIALRSRLDSWLKFVDFKRMSPVFQNVLQKHMPGIHAYGVQPPNDKKLAIVISRTFSWTDGIALIRQVYGGGDGRNVGIKTLEDSLFLIFLRISLPGFWDYPLLKFSEDARKRKSIDERFFYNCMESAIAKYMEEVNNYKDLDPLGECEKLYRYDVPHKEKLD